MLAKFLEEMLTLLGALIVAYFLYVFFTKKHDKSSGNSSAMAHSALRELVERAVDEARKLPGLTSSADAERILEERNGCERSYEDLLATTILNKVIEKFQKEQVDGNSNIVEEKSSTKTKNGFNESEFGLDEGVEEGSSSLEPLETLDSSQDECSSNCSGSRNSRILRHRKEPLSLTIEEQIEEVTTTYTSDEEPHERNTLRISRIRRVPFPELGMDIIDPSQESSEESQDEIDSPTGHVDLVSPLESWEENWLFQKKRIQLQSDPVAMLVPNSSADFKALIGDKDAEDTSDLSECSSAQSDEEIEKELIEAINNVAPRSPKISQSDLDIFINEEKFNNYQEREESLTESSSLSKSIISEEVPNCVTKNSTEFIDKNNKLNENFMTENGRISVEEKEAFTDILECNDQQKNKNSVDNWKTVHVTNDKQLEEVLSERNTEVTQKLMSQDTSNGSTMLETEVPKKSVTTNVQEILSDLTVLPANKKEVPSLSEDNRKELIDANCNNEEEEKGETNASFHLDLNATNLDMQGDDEAQQESEYTEHYDTATQRHLDSLTKSDFSSEQNDTINGEEKEGKEEEEEGEVTIPAEMRCRKAVASARAESASNSSSSLNNLIDEDIQLTAPPRPGTIAEREHKKWENAPPIENNPYSEESIQKRLLERQYSRRASDISGSTAELPKSDASELEVILGPHQPDIKRFSRDYYINNTKSASDDKSKKGAMRGSSRTASSLSQQEQQQVSFELERFEEASLRDSLNRRSYRDPRASAHFAINPLMHLETQENPSERTTESLGRWRSSTIEECLSNSKEEEDEEGNLSSQIKRSWTEENDDANASFLCEKVRTNPLYRLENEDSLTSLKSVMNDRDSGIDSIESNVESNGDPGLSSLREIKEEKEEERSTEECSRLSWLEESFLENAKENQILSTNWGRYLKTGTLKYHTFGGIRNSLFFSAKDKEASDFEDENFESEFNNEFITFGAPEFSNLKFQTFGGIKRSKRIDSKRIPNYRKIKLRPSLLNKGSKNDCNYFDGKIENIEHENGKIENEVVDNEEDDWEEENGEEGEEEEIEVLLENKKIKRRYLNNKDSRRNLNYNSSIKLSRKKKAFCGKQNSSSEICCDSKSVGEEENWLTDEEEDSSGDNSAIKMSIGPKSTLNSFFPYASSSSRKKYEEKRIIEGKKRYSPCDDGSLRLESPLVPEIIERNFESLKEMRKLKSRKEKSCKEKKTIKKSSSVRSLSDLTIW